MQLWFTSRVVENAWVEVWSVQIGELDIGREHVPTLFRRICAKFGLLVVVISILYIPVER